jgi:uncharacterized protein with von Willebrand factor type A (vWA) domain
MGCTYSSPNIETQNPIAEVNEEVIDTSNITPEQLASLSDEEVATIEMKKLKFFRRMKKSANRPSGANGMDYVILVDKSGSMRKGNRWEQARDAVCHLAPGACLADADGVTLYFFSSTDKDHKDIPPFTKFDNVNSADQVMKLFDSPSNTPKFGNDMTSVLRDVFASRKASTKGMVALMITDGAPDDKKAVESLIVEIANSLKDEDELGISIIQVGDDEQAQLWLKHLDDDLESSSKGRKLKSKFDIVETMSVQKLRNLDFSDIVRRSLSD